MALQLEHFFGNTWMLQWISHLVYDMSVIKIHGGNIEIDGEMHMGTPGMQALITERNPFRDYDPRSSYPRGNKSKKWVKILRQIWEDFQWEGMMSDEEEAEYHSTILGDGLYRRYLQKNRRCFNMHRDGNGLHNGTASILAGVSGMVSTFVWVLEYMMEKAYCWVLEILFEIFLYWSVITIYCKHSWNCKYNFNEIFTNKRKILRAQWIVETSVWSSEFGKISNLIVGWSWGGGGGGYHPLSFWQSRCNFRWRHHPHPRSLCCYFRNLHIKFA